MLKTQFQFILILHKMLLQPDPLILPTVRGSPGQKRGIIAGPVTPVPDPLFLGLALAPDTAGLPLLASHEKILGQVHTTVAGRHILVLQPTTVTTEILLPLGTSGVPRALQGSVNTPTPVTPQIPRTVFLTILEINVDVLPIRKKTSSAKVAKHG